MKKLILISVLCGLILTGCGLDTVTETVRSFVDDSTEETEGISFAEDDDASKGIIDLKDNAAMTADFETCLGDLLYEADLTDEQINQLLEEFIPMWNLRQERLAAGEPYMGRAEWELFSRFSNSLDDICYDTYEEEGWDYGTSVEEYELADYPINEDGSLGEAEFYEDWDIFDYTDEEIRDVWDQVIDILPDDSLDVFTDFYIFTDGTDYTVAFTSWDDTDPEDVIWTLAIDPEDTYDEEYLKETLVHEYCHYMTLNGSQAVFGTDGNVDVYCEEGYYELKEDSYLNQFYQQFWDPILKDEALVCSDNTMFYYRYYEDYFDDYCCVDPAEDIAECFIYYIYGSEEAWNVDDPEVWQQKIIWLDQIEEFRDFRDAVLAKES